MAGRGRPKKTEVAETTIAEPKKRGRKPNSTSNVTTVKSKVPTPERKPIRLSEIHEGDLDKLKKELTREITKEVMRTIVNPLVKEFQKIDK